jgi:hypothetical protein
MTMIYRQLDANGDYQVGQFLANSPAAVAQAVETRLKLWRGEWFLDIPDGTPWLQDILGHNTNYDLEIQKRILDTPGVTEIVSYSSNVDSARGLSVVATLNTQYGQVTVQLPQ